MGSEKPNQSLNSDAKKLRVIWKQEPKAGISGKHVKRC